MPVKRRKSKLRLDDIFTWDAPLLFGIDMIHTLHMAGIPVNEDLTLDRQTARSAWRLYGTELLERWGADAATKCKKSWAMQEFGAP